jgi:hypothetical protein
MFVCCVCCALSGRGLCDELITRSKESYRQWRFVVCDQETSWTRRLQSQRKLIIIIIINIIIMKTEICNAICFDTCRILRFIL